MIWIDEDGVLMIAQTAGALDQTCELLKKLQKVAMTTHGRIPRRALAGR